jgi:hypothetical protein
VNAACVPGLKLRRHSWRHRLVAAAAAHSRTRQRPPNQLPANNIKHAHGHTVGRTRLESGTPSFATWRRRRYGFGPATAALSRLVELHKSAKRHAGTKQKNGGRRPSSGASVALAGAVAGAPCATLHWRQRRRPAPAGSGCNALLCRFSRRLRHRCLPVHVVIIHRAGALVMNKVLHCRQQLRRRKRRVPLLPRPILLQVSLPEPMAAHSSGAATQSGVALPPHLRRLLQSGGDSNALDSAAAAPQRVPVILAVAPGSPAVAVNATSGRIIDASAVNTTRCIRYAPGYNASSGGGGDAGAARPPLDLSGCLASQLVVASGQQDIVVQVSRLRFAQPPKPAFMHLCIWGMMSAASAGGGNSGSSWKAYCCPAGNSLICCLLAWVPAGSGERAGGQHDGGGSGRERRYRTAGRAAVPRRRLPSL